MMNYFVERGIQTPCSAEVVKSLLAASSTGFWDIRSRERFLTLAQMIVRDDQFMPLKAEIAHRQSVLMRLRGDIKGSELAIRTFLSTLHPGSNDMALEEVAALHLSQATNHTYHFSFSEAHEEVKKWVPIDGLLERQQHLLWDQILCVGRIMRGEGCFQEAKICFETCFRTPGLRQSKRLLVKSALADLYCELDYLGTEQPASYLSGAEAMVRPEIERLRLSSCQHLKGFRRLLLSLIEVKLRQEDWQDVDSLTRELLSLYGNLREVDIVDRLGHVRALIAFARVSSTLQDALERWKDVLVWNRLYNPLEEDVFTCGIVYLFLCLKTYMLGKINESMKNLQNARGVIERNRRQFLIPGIGTYLFYDVCSQVQQTTGWCLEIPQ